MDATASSYPLSWPVWDAPWLIIAAIGGINDGKSCPRPLLDPFAHPLLTIPELWIKLFCEPGRATPLPSHMPRDGFFVASRKSTKRRRARRAQHAPAEQHAKELKLFLERVKDYPLDFEKFIDIVRGPYSESLEETAIPAESPSFVHGSRHCPLMAKGKSVERQLLHLWWHFTLGRSMSLKVDQQWLPSSSCPMIRKKITRWWTDHSRTSQTVAKCGKHVWKCMCVN